MGSPYRQTETIYGCYKFRIKDDGNRNYKCHRINRPCNLSGHKEFNNTNQLNLNTNLRVSNLENSLKRYEQKQNELYNKVKRQKLQKNFTGSHSNEPMVSPEQTAHRKQTTPILDLTGEKPVEASIPKWKVTPSRQHRNTKLQRRNTHTQDFTRKAVQWREAEVRNYNPDTPAIPTNPVTTWQTHNTPTANPMNTPLFHSTYPPFIASTQNTTATPIYFPTQVGHFNPLPHMQAPYHNTKPLEHHHINPFQQFPQPHVTSRTHPFGTQNLPTKK
jgi:hypothetical protein